MVRIKCTESAVKQCQYESYIVISSLFDLTVFHTNLMHMSYTKTHTRIIMKHIQMINLKKIKLVGNVNLRHL